MHDSEFFAQILGITAPWFITKVELDRAKQKRLAELLDVHTVLAKG